MLLFCLVFLSFCIKSDCFITFHPLLPAQQCWVKVQTSSEVQLSNSVRVYMVKFNPLVSAGRNFLFSSVCVREQILFHSYIRCVTIYIVYLMYCPASLSLSPQHWWYFTIDPWFLIRHALFVCVSGPYLKCRHIFWKAHSVPQNQCVCCVRLDLISSFSLVILPFYLFIILPWTKCCVLSHYSVWMI